MQVIGVNQNMQNITLLTGNTGMGQVSTDISSVSNVPSRLQVTTQAPPNFPSYENGINAGAFKQLGNVTNTYLEALYGNQVTINDQNPLLYRGPYNDPVKGDSGLTWFHYDPTSSPTKMCTPLANDTSGMGWYDRAGVGNNNARGCFSTQKTVLGTTFVVGSQEQFSITNDISTKQSPSVWTVPLYPSDPVNGPFTPYAPSWVIGTVQWLIKTMNIGMFYI